MNSLDYHRIFHEIKNTVTIINSSMQLLDHKCPNLHQELHWQNTKQEILYLKTMILEISLNGNMDHICCQPLDFNQLIESVCLNFNDTFPSMKVKLDLSAPLPFINGDETKLKQTMFNLLKNSAEAMDENGCIIVRSSYNDSFIQIDLTDEGGGIPPEFENKVFDLFTTSKENGTGLGLPITRQIIEKHGGTITLQNHYGKGCTFSIQLPTSTHQKKGCI